MLIKIAARAKIPSALLFVEFIARRGKSSTASAPTILLAPGGPGGDHGIYKKQVQQLSEYANVIIFDPRGCGESSITNPSEYSMDVYIDDIEAIRRHFKLRRFILLGTSYGSMAAQGYAIKYKKALDALILVAGAPSYEFIDMAKKELKDVGTPAQKKMFSRLLNGEMENDDDFRDYFTVMAPLYTTKFLKKTLGKQKRNTKVNEEEEFHSAKKNVRYNAQAALSGFGPNGFLRSFDWRKKLSQLSCPVRVIVGEFDWINNPKQAMEIKALVKDCSVKIVPGGKHTIWDDQQKIYFSWLKRTIKSLQKKSSKLTVSS